MTETGTCNLIDTGGVGPVKECGELGVIQTITGWRCRGHAPKGWRDPNALTPLAKQTMELLGGSQLGEQWVADHMKMAQLERYDATIAGVPVAIREDKNGRWEFMVQSQKHGIQMQGEFIGPNAKELAFITAQGMAAVLTLAADRALADSANTSKVKASEDVDEGDLLSVTGKIIETGPGKAPNIVEGDGLDGE